MKVQCGEGEEQGEGDGCLGEKSGV
jgi:hypothetical protein